MFGYDLMENDRPANITRYNGSYSTHLFANKVMDLIRNHDTSKVRNTCMGWTIYM